MASKHIHGNKRNAVLVDDFDVPFLDCTSKADERAIHPSVAAGLLRGCADSIKQMRGGATMFMTGTFRVSHPILEEALLDSFFVDLSLDMLHNNTWGFLARDLELPACLSHRGWTQLLFPLSWYKHFVM